MKLRARHLALALVLLLASVGACRRGESVTPPVVTPPASAEAKEMTKSGPALPSVRVVLDDPRLASARALERAKDWAAAARAVHDARPQDLPAAEACGWDFLEGRLAMLAHVAPEPKDRDPQKLAERPALLAEAVGAFERAESPACPLAGHARLRMAQALARAGRADEAIARARAVPEDLASVADDVKIVIAEALAAKGDRAAALPLWRAWLAANPHGSRWVDTSVRVATALLDGVDGPAEARAREAFDTATRVITEAPKLAESSGAMTARSRAAALLRAKDPAASEALSDAERARQAQAWLDANEPQRAFELATAVVKTSPNSCRAALTRANAAAKKTPKADVWSDTVTACEKDGELVTALYAGAKARSGKDPKLAVEWFSRVEQLFPAHRLADDARFRAAMIVAQGSDEGHEDRSEQMLRTLPDAYPAGDMRTEALFRVALAKMQRGRTEDWEAAKPLLDRILEIAPDDRHWHTVARAEYFRARAAAATGDAEGARTRFERIVERHPFAFYMLLSYGRLAAADPARARRVLDAAVLRDREGTFPSRVHPVLESPGFQRGLRLLEVGDIEAARRELAAAGATGEGADPEVLWTVGAIYNAAGAPEIGHAIARGRVSDHLEHYPEGRWRFPWETAYPRAFQPLVVKACEKYGLPLSVAWGIMREESNFFVEAKSPANAYGLMQIIIPTAKGLTGGTGFGSDEASLKTAEVSIELGTKLLAGLRKQHGHPALAIGAYNGGSGAIGRWMAARSNDDLDLFVENVPWEETRNYIKRVLSSVAAYGYLYDRKTFEEALALPVRLGR